MTLLAKSKDEKRNIAARTLKEHIDDCLFIFDFLKEAFPKAADVSGLGQKFWDLLKTAIICHDLGKAHCEFQKLLNGEPDKWKSQRHELFSLPFVEALSNLGKEDIDILKLVVAGHHKDFEKLREALNFYESDGFGMLETIDEEVEAFDTSFKKYVGQKSALELLHQYGISVNTIIPKPIHGFVHYYNKQPYRLNNEKYFALMLLFGGLKWCDHLGSAMVTDLKILTPKSFAFLLAQQKNLQEKGLDFYSHQKKAAMINDNLILTAPTGSGKTESAFLWLQNQLQVNGQGRAFYILPFTASINAMYQRSNKAIGDECVGMLHGKLSEYLNNYFDELQYSTAAKKDSIQNIKEKFKSIVTPVKVATPFQLLKHLFGLKGYEQGIFEMAGAYIIFDEIHAYSPEVFAQIKALLEFSTKYLGVKVMIMTATMPTFLQEELEHSLGKFALVKADETLYKDFRRHKVVLQEGFLHDNLEEVKNSLQAGKKVLVVCNTVKAAQTVFKELRTDVEEGKALLLHGSFTGADRARIEKDLMQKEINLLVGTQAIEVSLDIDYDIIYSEPAPIDALIQRFGRVNRKREKGICECIVFKEHNSDDEYIYEPVLVGKTIQALEKIIHSNKGIIDEALLQQSINEVYDKWTTNDKKKFEDQYKYLSAALQLLAPMFKNKYTEEDFYKQFDGIKILPQINKDAFEECLNNFDFIGAESQKVQIRKGRFKGWLQSGNLKKDVFAFGKNSKLNVEYYFVTNKKYNSELGLLADEGEGWKTTEIF